MDPRPTFKRRVFLSHAAMACGGFFYLGAMAQSAPLEIAGSAAMHKLVFEKNGPAIKAATGVEVKYASNSTGKGLLALLEGKVAVAAVADNLRDAVESVRKMSPGVKVPDNLKFHEVFTDHVVAIIHRDNASLALTRAQIKGIFSGSITNWKEVGGADQPIKVVVGPAGAATTEAFLKPILEGSKLSGGATELRTASAMLSEVARDKHAIGSASLDVAEKASNIHIVAGVQVSRPMGFATVGEAPPELAKLVAFLKSAAGQKMLTE